MREILNSKSTFQIKSYQIGHSQLVLVNADSNQKIQFEGVFYMEIPRLLNGCRIVRANENDLDELKKRKIDFPYTKYILWKIITTKNEFFVLGLAVKIYEMEKLTCSD